jgi:hypothetical protein
MHESNVLMCQMCEFEGKNFNLNKKIENRNSKQKNSVKRKIVEVAETLNTHVVVKNNKTI